MLRYFQLEASAAGPISCDSEGCDAAAEFLAIEEDGTEYYLCSTHTLSKSRVLRLRSKPA